MNGADQWYYLAGSETRGPVPAAEIVRLLQNGSLPPTTQVAQAGWQTWSPASVALGNLMGGPQPGAGAPNAHPMGAQPTYAIKLQCVAGPDAGKAYMIGVAEVSLGRVSGIGEHDPHVADNHVVVSWQNNVLHFRTFPGADVRVAGNPVTQGTLSNGQQFQMGASTWQVGSAPVELTNLLGNLNARLNQLTSTEKLEGFSLKAMFSEVFKKRQPGEIEDYFVVGTSKTTPALDEVQTGWPRPWFFLRVLAFLAGVYVVFWQSFSFFGNPNDFPGAIMIGALAVPLATVVLLWEMNTPRNVSFIQVLMMVALGGAVSLLLFEIVDRLSHVDWIGPPSAGLVEETAKLLAVILIVRSTKHKYILNGIVFGAAIGAGFSTFETAGYAFYHGYMPQAMHDTFRAVAANSLTVHDMTWNQVINLYASGKRVGQQDLEIWSYALSNHGFSAFTAGLNMITDRAPLAQFGHIVWTAIAGGAFWRVKGGDPFRIQMLTDRAFVRTFLIPVVLHATWDMPWGRILTPILGEDFMQAHSDLAFNLVYYPLGIIAWYVAFLLVQQGLRQIKDAQVAQAQTEYKRTQEVITTSGRFRVPQFR